MINIPIFYVKVCRAEKKTKQMFRVASDDCSFRFLGMQRYAFFRIPIGERMRLG